MLIQERHPTVADQIVCHLQGVPESPRLISASEAAASLDGVDGRASSVSFGQRLRPVEPDACQPGCSAGVAA